MTNTSSRKGSIFPSSGNEEADSAWAALVAQRDLELLFMGDDEHLRKTLHEILKKQQPSDAELAYFVDVLRSA